MSVYTFRHNPYAPCVLYPCPDGECEYTDSSCYATSTSGSCGDYEAGAADWCGGAWYEEMPPPPAYDSVVPEGSYASGPSAAGATPRGEDAVADHFKTRLCKKFAARGTCPYGVHCRFAHGEEDLHTYSQNVRMGLVTEEAVRDYQRRLAAAILCEGEGVPCFCATDA